MDGLEAHRMPRGIRQGSAYRLGACMHLIESRIFSEEEDDESLRSNSESPTSAA